MAKKAAERFYPVIDYDAMWDFNKNYGSISITPRKGDAMTIKQIGSHTEFIAILTLLQGEKTVFVSQAGVLSTRP